MIFLKNDYSMGAHPDVLAKIVECNAEYNDTYEDDVHTANVTRMVREMIGQPEADVHFILGGGLANRTCMAAFLRPYDAVITTTDGHIAVHEAGSVESTGHRVLEVPSPDGKMRPEQIDEIVALHNMDQMVIPKVAYISNTTELGTIYTKEEMLAIREACDRHDMYLYMDGARLGTLLGAEKNDLTMADIAEITDAFYVGGNKCGALIGEMAVITNPHLKENFRRVMRQNGSLVARSAIIAMQFEALLENDLYTQLGRKCNEMARKLAEGVQEKGYELAYAPDSNMVYVKVSKELSDALMEKVMMYVWEEHEDHNVIRLLTGWATKQEDIDAFLALV